MNRIMECVPNFSEGRDKNVIHQIADAIASVNGVKVLNIDAGEAANRTVITFAGEPEAVSEAAFLGAKAASELIDMRHHHGTHPRIGATDVLPFVPVRGITLHECAEMARQLGRRMADELGIPVYLYEAAALRPKFRNLAVCRAGEYEGIAQKIATPGEEPDYMPPSSMVNGQCSTLNAQCSMFNVQWLTSGCSVVGARDFLIAVNFNLDTKSVAVATDIAREIRERGYQGRPGTLKCVKAIGWYIEEYGFAQVSCNLTNYHVTSLLQTFQEVSRVALLHGVHVTGTEIIGLVPEDALPPDPVRTLGLDQLRPFRLEEKVLEFTINN